MLSYHVLVDSITDTELDQLLTHLKEYKPPYINIMGGSKFQQAQALVEWLYWEIPETTVILRRWPDDGLIKKYNYDMDLWYNEVIKPHEQWLKKYQPIWLLDNESVEDDLRPYAKASAEAMDIMGAKGLRLAVGRFAAGNPKEHQYAELDEMWKVLKRWGFHIWSPNEYFDKPEIGFGSGSIARFLHGLNRCKDKFSFVPEIVIGEFGLANNYNPFSSWRETSLTEEEYANLCLAYDRMWYQPYGITACIFSVGKWKSFHVSQIFFLVVGQNKPDKPETPEQPEPPEPQGCFDLIVRNPISQGVNMLSAFLNVVKEILTNRTFAVPLISGALMLLVSNGVITVNDAEIWTERIFQIMLILMGMNGAFDIANVAKGNTYNANTRSWES